MTLTFNNMGDFLEFMAEVNADGKMEEKYYIPGPSDHTFVRENTEYVVTLRYYAMPDDPPHPPPPPPRDRRDDDDDDTPSQRYPDTDPTPNRTTIPDAPVPLAPPPITIMDDQVPLASLPKTGGSSAKAASLSGLGALIAGFVLSLKNMRKGSGSDAE
jgi:LPXTG-motif cell wall-anchored protein